VTEVLASPAATVTLIILTLLAVVAGYVVLRVIIPSGAARQEEDAVRRAAINSVIPIASQLVIRVNDLAVAIVLLRLLGPTGNGRYALAVILWLYVKTISDFGLSLLTTREIARDHTAAGHLVGTTTLMRLVVLLLASVPAAGYLVVGVWHGSLAVETAVTAFILLLSIVPSSYTEAINSALNGLERMAAAAWLNIAVSFVRAPLVIVLAASRLDVVGVAIAAVVAAAMSADLYRRAFRKLSGERVIWALPAHRARWLLRESWPLLANALLVNLFFRVDVFIIQGFRGDAALGMYDAAYKLINLVTIVPAYVTLAIFPTLAHRGSDPVGMARVQAMATYVLVWIAWGIVAVVSGGADIAIRVLAGSAYLPDAAHMLRLLIWFAPLSFMNGVVQYVLVAANHQRQIVPVFGVAVTFNLLANLALVPMFGAFAAAAVTVATEVVIALTFLILGRRLPLQVFPAELLRIWRPTTIGITASAVAIIAADRIGPFAAVVIAGALYIALSIVARVFGPDELNTLRRALGRRRKVEVA
jgi:O-antigen/teichoic acid export membrane protein